ncbi:MAG: hypothetical protein ACKVW3_14050 [Phycisphaerales bacterium]
MPDDRDALRDFLADRDAPCPACDYNLRGLKADRCPECDRVLELGLIGTTVGMWPWRFTLMGLLALLSYSLVNVWNVARIFWSMGGIPLGMRFLHTVFWVTHLCVVIAGCAAMAWAAVMLLRRRAAVDRTRWFYVGVIVLGGYLTTICVMSVLMHASNYLF